MTTIKLNNKTISQNHPPFIIAEIGITHEGVINKAKQMADDAALAGADCVKFQMHVIQDEMVGQAKKVIPANAKESIWDIMSRCSLTKQEHIELKQYVEDKGLIYLCTPFSRAAADILNDMHVQAFKIGSGECNNYPLVEHIASFKKPILLSTGMNDIPSIQKSVDIMEKAQVPYVLFHCTSMYPTPYDKVRLNALNDLRQAFPNAILGLSDHSLGHYTSLAAIPLGARVLENHFTSDKGWPGPDVPISLDPQELKELVIGSQAIFAALQGKKEILPEEQPTIDFAYASVVAIKNISQGEKFTKDNLWVKRPGTGIPAERYSEILGKTASRHIAQDELLQQSDIL